MTRLLALMLTLTSCADPTCRVIFDAAVKHNDHGIACGAGVITPDSTRCEAALERCDDLDHQFIERLVACTGTIDACDGTKRRDVAADVKECDAHEKAIRQACRTALVDESIDLWMGIEGVGEDQTCKAIREGVAKRDAAAAPCGAHPQHYDDARCPSALTPCTDPDRNALKAAFACEIRWCDGDQPSGHVDEDAIACSRHLLDASEPCRAGLVSLKESTP